MWHTEATGALSVFAHPALAPLLSTFRAVAAAPMSRPVSNVEAVAIICLLILACTALGNTYNVCAYYYERRAPLKHYATAIRALTDYRSI